MDQLTRRKCKDSSFTKRPGGLGASSSCWNFSSKVARSNLVSCIRTNTERYTCTHAPTCVRPRNRQRRDPGKCERAIGVRGLLTGGPATHRDGERPPPPPRNSPYAFLQPPLQFQQPYTKQQPYSKEPLFDRPLGIGQHALQRDATGAASLLFSSQALQTLLVSCSSSGACASQAQAPRQRCVVVIGVPSFFLRTSMVSFQINFSCYF